jgi:hypothetical protein
VSFVCPVATTLADIVRGSILSQVSVGVKPFFVCHKTFAEFLGQQNPARKLLPAKFILPVNNKSKFSGVPQAPK